MRPEFAADRRRKPARRCVGAKQITGRLAAAVALAVVIAACTEAKPGQQPAGAPGGAAATSHAPEASGSRPGAQPSDTTHARKVAAALARLPARDQPVEVVNNMELPMVVTAVMGTQTQPLGTLEPKQEKKYDLHVPAGAYVLIRASDSTRKHEVQAVMTGVGPVLHFVIR